MNEGEAVIFMNGWTPEPEIETLRGTFGTPPLLTYAIGCPRLCSLLPAAQRIDRLCRARAQALEQQCCGPVLREARRQKSVMQDSFTALEISVSVQFTRCGDGLLSGFADGYHQLGARGSRLARFSRTFALETGLPVPLPALFRPGVLWQRPLLAALDAEMRRRAAEEPGCFHKNAAALMRRRLSPHGYYLADDGLAVWFPQGSVAPGNAGLPTFLVRYDDLRALLRWKL